MIWAQLIGLVGVALIVATWQFNKRKTILRVQLLASLVWTLHFILLGAHTGAAMNFMMAVRNYAFDRYRRKQWVFWLFMVLITAAGVITWQNTTSILPLVATLIATTAVWMKKPHHIRWLMLAVPPLWFTYNAFSGSYAGMLGDTVGFIAVLAGIYRFDIRKNLALRPATVKVKSGGTSRRTKV